MKRKEVGVIIFLIILINFTSAIPYILFVNPTPADGYRTTSSGEVVINSTINNVSSLTELIWNWDSVNYSLYDEDLVLMYNFENNSLIGENDALVVDVSRGGNNGSVINGNNISVGKFGYGRGFNDSNYINITNNLGLENGFTIGLWVKTEQTNVSSLSCSRYSCCVLTTQGKIFCWGDNTNGNLGDNSNVSKYSPTSFYWNGAYNISKLVKGSEHTCILLTNGSVMCWGADNIAQLGDNNAKTYSFSPVFVYGGYNFSDIQSGTRHICGNLTNGTWLCWGRGDAIGYGGSANVDYPIAIKGGYNFTSFALGTYSSCGLLENGSALCWGSNTEGQLGIGIGNKTTMYFPVPVYGNYNFSSLFKSNSNLYTTCGILQNGSVVCWGNNDYGQLIENQKTSSDIPKILNLNYTFSNIYLGNYHICGTLTNGSLMCWGYFIQGQGWDGSKKTASEPKIVGNYGFKEFASGGFFNCGLYFNGSVICGGRKDVGEIGQFYSTDEFYEYFPVPVYGNYNFSSIEIKKVSGCGILQNGSALCWGGNSKGQLISSNFHNTNQPVFVENYYNVSFLKIGGDHTCELLYNGSVLCGGYNFHGQLGNGNTETVLFSMGFVLGNYNFSSLELGGFHTCGLLENGSAMCWGNNDYGQLGNGSVGNAYLPQFVLGGYNFSSLVMGNLHSCGILQNGSLLCWGRNNVGQLGNGNITNMYGPVFVRGDNIFKSVKLGAVASCGLLHNGSELCWGGNTYGQLGIGNLTNIYTPISVSGGHNFSSISAGSYHNCGLLQNGSAMCWGNNTNAMIGDYSKNPSYVPKLVSTSHTFSYISSGTGFNCGLLQNGSALCWGGNDEGQLGANLFDYTYTDFPQEILKGYLIGKSVDSYIVSSTLLGDITGYVGGSKFTFNTSKNSWSYISLTYDKNYVKLYINGELVSEEGNNAIVKNNSFPFFIGKDVLGKVDEVRVYNRSLSASEVNQLYRTNLNKINNSAWEFYATENLNSGDKTYSYSLFALEGGTSFKVLRSIIKYSLSSEDEEEYSSGAELKEIILNKRSLEKGFNLNVKEGLEVGIPIEDFNKIIEIKEINPDTDKIIITSDNKEYNLFLNESIKIDLDNDGYYDIKVSNKKNYGKVSSLEFKLIHEEIPAEEQEEVIEEVEEELVGGEPEVSVEKESNWLKVGGIVVGIVILVLIIVFSHKKIKRKKRYKKFGY